jgi:hypothetical protein
MSNIVNIEYNITNTNNINYEFVEILGIKKFNSGDFVKDWYNLIKYCVQNQLNNIFHSSSVNHFIMDGALYKSKYLYTYENGEFELKNEYSENEIEFFIEKDKNYTWDELKKRCEY